MTNQVGFNYSQQAEKLSPQQAQKDYDAITSGLRNMGIS